MRDEGLENEHTLSTESAETKTATQRRREGVPKTAIEVFVVESSLGPGTLDTLFGEVPVVRCTGTPEELIVGSVFRLGALEAGFWGRLVFVVPSSDSTGTGDDVRYRQEMGVGT